jgi:hypothetical protein
MIVVVTLAGRFSKTNRNTMMLNETGTRQSYVRSLQIVDPAILDLNPGLRWFADDVVDICCGYLLWIFVVDICCGYLLWTRQPANGFVATPSSPHPLPRHTPSNRTWKATIRIDIEK